MACSTSSFEFRFVLDVYILSIFCRYYTNVRTLCIDNIFFKLEDIVLLVKDILFSFVPKMKINIKLPKYSTEKEKYYLNVWKVDKVIFVTHLIGCCQLRSAHELQKKLENKIKTKKRLI